MTCPRCGKAASGKFCIECGAAVAATTCGECDGTIVAGARFCQHCGAAAGDGPTKGGALSRHPLTWAVPGVAVLAVIAYFVGQQLANKSDASANATPLAEGAPTAPFAGGVGGGGGAGSVDISKMSPEERASRLFDRVMRYGEQGKLDSVKIFAPMAIQSYEMLGNATNHSRYDIGMISVVSLDAARAAAEADTILKDNPQHLLGLVLAIKAAGLRNDLKARAAFEKRFLTAEPSERAKKVLEYEDHKSDVDAALTAANGKK